MIPLRGLLIENSEESALLLLRELERVNVCNALLKLFAEKASRKEYLDAVVDLIHNWSCCRCVGIRLLDDEGNIQYESYHGFNKAFRETENRLSIKRDQCACIRVITGKMEPQDAPFLTPAGSFRCENTRRLFGELSEQDPAKFRCVCAGNGFMSVAIVPVRYREKVIGAIHLADEMEGKVPLKSVEFIESITPLIGEAVHRFNLEEELQRNYDTETVINALLSLALKDILLEELLKNALDLLLSIPWLSFESRGGIFLVENEPEVLTLKAHKGLYKTIEKGCARVPFGRCLCGQAALTREIQFTENLDDRHDVIYGGIAFHGHYCVPILSSGRILGVINLYLRAGHRRYQRDEEFLKAAANTLAGIIMRKRAEDVLRESEKRFRLMADTGKKFKNEVEAATQETRRELSQLKKDFARSMGVGEICVFSEAMRSIFKQAYKFHTDRSIPVLIQGETGTGKEVVARYIHFGNSNVTAPFVDINCAALTPGIFESELFGYEAGAFTGGLPKGQRGKLDIAKGGTIFLDEITELSVELQAKLLRVIQEKEFYRVGGLKKIKTDVRIVCTTNINIEKRVKEGAFRQDLFYRLNVGRLFIPPLRERTEAILPLAVMFLRSFAKKRRKRFNKVSNSAANILLSYQWPGNVRELKNIMELTTLIHDDVELKPSHLNILSQAGTKKCVPEGVFPVVDPINFSLPAGGLDLDSYLDEIVRRAYEMHNGNKTETARYLGISRSSLYCHLKRLKTKSPDVFL